MILDLTWVGTRIAVSSHRIDFIENHNDRCIIYMGEHSMTVDESYDEVRQMMEPMSSMPKASALEV